MTKARQTAQAFLNAAKADGFTPVIKTSSVVAITKSFTPGDKDAFTDCDMTAPSLLDQLGARGGSVWGTDGGSVGGAIALNNGRFTLSVSGVPKRVTDALQKIL